jgi:hypothetical protein
MRPCGRARGDAGVGVVYHSWQKLGRQIRGHLKPHTLQKRKLTAVEVSGADDGSWSRINTKEHVEALLINRNIEQFSHAGDTPFG